MAKSISMELHVSISLGNILKQIMYMFHLLNSVSITSDLMVTFRNLQNELDLGMEETPSLPFLPQQQSQTATQSTLSGSPVSSNAFGQGLRSDLNKNTAFSNAISGLQHFHLSQGGAVRSNDSSRDPNPPTSDGSSMEMHDPTY